MVGAVKNPITREERARAVVVLRGLTARDLALKSVREISEGVDFGFGTRVLHRMRRELLQNVEGDMSDFVMPIDSQVVAQQAALENIAAIVTKTYSYCGDNETIASEDALQL